MTMRKGMKAMSKKKKPQTVSVSEKIFDLQNQIKEELIVQDIMANDWSYEEIEKSNNSVDTWSKEIEMMKREISAELRQNI